MTAPTEERSHLTLAGTGTAPGSERAFVVVYEPERTRVLDLPDGAEITFGRSRACTVNLDSEKVSRKHTRIVRRGLQVTVEDLGSRNGTFVNGARVAAPVPIGPGDEVGVGNATAVLGMSVREVRRPVVGSADYLDERLEAEVDRATRYRRPLGLIMFRIVGPVDGAEAMIDRIAAGLRRMDTIAEYGPDEIAVLVPEADRRAAETCARRLAARARDGATDDVTLHVGLAVLPRDGTTSGELLGRVRDALRAARAGKGDAGVSGPPDEGPAPVGDVVMVDPQMKRVFALAEKAAPTPVTVLILGETGVGKEVVAEHIHARSGRAQKSFVRLNCASLPPTLLESELFGHEKGAFTGADRRKIGFFEAASGGTLFLDEIGEIPLPLQVKLLRVLQERTITRVGGTEEIPVDVRVLCATHRDLLREITEGRFREDLYYRISAFTIVVPPLRARKAEIEPLATLFARQFARELGHEVPGFSSGALEAMMRHDWPGNVRELRNAVERAMVLGPEGVILPEHLPEVVVQAAPPAGPDETPGLRVVDVRQKIANVERDAIVAALEATGGNQTQAARRLGISRRALIYKMEKHGLKKPPS